MSESDERALSVKSFIFVEIFTVLPFVVTVALQLSTREQIFQVNWFFGPL